LAPRYVGPFEILKVCGQWHIEFIFQLS
jgi:hypothetical protein